MDNAATSSGSMRVNGSKSPSLASDQLAPPSCDLKMPTLGVPDGVSVPA